MLQKKVQSAFKTTLEVDSDSDESNMIRGGKRQNVSPLKGLADSEILTFKKYRKEKQM